MEAHRRETVLVKVLEREAARVRKPAAVHFGVATRHHTVDVTISVIQPNVCTERVVHRNRRRVGQEPYTLLEAEVLRGHGAHGANVSHAKVIFVIELFTRERSNVGMVGAASELQLFGTGNRTHKAHATVALHAAFFVEQNTGTEVHMLTTTELALRINELVRRITMVVLAVFGAHTRFVLARFHIVFLKGAFTGLVANRAIEGVVHQHEFLRCLAGILHTGTGCRRINLHTRSDRRVACNHKHAAARAFLFHQALAAVTGHRQIRVVTDVRSFNPDSLQSFEQVRVARNHHRLVVHEDFHLRAVLSREFRHVIVVTHIITRKFQDDSFPEHAAWRGRGSLRSIHQSRL